MPMVRAMRLLNAIESGSITGAQLQILLADPGRLSEFSALFANRGQVRRMAMSATTMNAIASSALARNAIGNTSASPGYGTIARYPMAVGKLVAGAAGLDPSAYADIGAVAASTPAMTAVAASEWAIYSLASSAIAVLEVDSRASARALFYGSPVGGGYLGLIHEAVGSRYLVVQAPKATGENVSVAWKTTNDTSVNTTNLDFGLVNANAQNNANHPLFSWARGLTIGGYTDWAPPAYNVIAALVEKMRSANADNALFKAGGAQVYESSIYWAANQSQDLTSAWAAHFSTAALAYYSKTIFYRCRAVRIVKL